LQSTKGHAHAATSERLFGLRFDAESLLVGPEHLLELPRCVRPFRSHEHNVVSQVRQRWQDIGDVREVMPKFIRFENEYAHGFHFKFGARSAFAAGLLA
jgi:hypothetical protein